MKNYKFVLPFIIVIQLYFYGCYTKVTDSNSNDELNQVFEKEYFVPSDNVSGNYTSITLLFKEWKHSREEETDSVQIYRPADSRDFPVSRYREVLEFFRNGEFKYLYLSPVDAHYFKYGKWGISRRDSNIIGLQYTPQRTVRIKIIQLNRNFLSFVME